MATTSVNKQIIVNLLCMRRADYNKMCEELRLERFDKSPWGFRLTGGLDFGAPLSVVKVTGGSLAELGGVQVGDLVVEISGQSTKNMTHTDAQNIIGVSQRTLNLIVMRGSLVTPPDVTPLRGMTPMTEVDNQRLSINSLNSELLNERLKNLKNVDHEDGVKSPAQVHVNGSMTAEMINRVAHHTSPQGDPKMTVDVDMSETELDELLTGNEEVLDQGVLGINFKKFMPQVDFIRQSEVFKFLQRQNVHKELPEEVQLEKEPEKRFSTFLQKPRAPPRGPTGPLWIHPRPPRYLSKDECKPPELPKRRFRAPKEDPGHSVLWLFLSEDGEDVEDERWGTVEEERLNISRNEIIEYDRSSVASMKSRSEGTYSNLENPISDIRADTSCEVSDSEEISKSDDKKKPKFVAKCTIEEVAEIEDEPCEAVSREAAHDRIDTDESNDTSSKSKGRGKLVKVDIKETTNVSSETMERTETSVTKESTHITSRKEEERFSKQLADIKAQIAALEEQAPPDLQSQLLNIHDHLEKIVKLKLAQSAQFQEEKQHFKETMDENAEDEEEEEEVEEEEVEEHIEIEEKITEKQIFEERVEEKIIEKTETRVVLVNEDGEEVDGMDDEEVEEGEISGEDVGGGMKAFKKGEYQLCEAPEPPRRSRGPITPQARPIVLPGGRQWRQPKDAACEEFYTGILVAQADVLIGSDEGGVNFTKYVPPKFDMSHSAVYRLIHEIEDRTNQNQNIEECYQAPLNKRHFYAAKLKPPPPIGEVELKDL
ncbi:hypothetical protein GE061_011959 [Apolygus lucorum]|uniref:PDZ domain-containing protein n=1 Tax=Apolygus lucorum TaxID=248454 RepID=A0A8S9XR81_APOLU|nr:hypothetical protein GE061_011959 [Apolygus lucorum]